VRSVWVYSSMCRVWALYGFKGSGYRVQGSGFLSLHLILSCLSISPTDTHGPLNLRQAPALEEPSKPP